MKVVKNASDQITFIVETLSIPNESRNTAKLRLFATHSPKPHNHSGTCCEKAHQNNWFSLTLLFNRSQQNLFIHNMGLFIQQYFHTALVLPQKCRANIRGEAMHPGWPNHYKIHLQNRWKQGLSVSLLKYSIRINHSWIFHRMSVQISSIPIWLVSHPEVNVNSFHQLARFIYQGNRLLQRKRSFSECQSNN